MSKTTRKTYSAKFKMAVAVDAVRGEKTLSQVASEHGASPSLASEWRDEALRTIGQLTVERDFLRRFCDDNGYDPEEARGGR